MRVTTYKNKQGVFSSCRLLYRKYTRDTLGCVFPLNDKYLLILKTYIYKNVVPI